jgi:hypothetical protein
VNNTDAYVKRCKNESGNAGVCFLLALLDGYIQDKNTLDFITKLYDELRNLAFYTLLVFIIMFISMIFTMYLTLSVAKNGLTRLNYIIFSVSLIAIVAALILTYNTFNTVNKRLQMLCNTSDSVISSLGCTFFGSILIEYRDKLIVLLALNSIGLLIFITVSVLVFIRIKRRNDNLIL